MRRSSRFVGKAMNTFPVSSHVQVTMEGATLDLLCFLPAGEFIIGRVIKAMNNSWHPECFCCDLCQEVLADIGFVKNAGRWEG